MPMTIQQSKDSNQLNLLIKQRFDFSIHKVFRGSYINHHDRGTEFIVDLSQTTYMDSSALGMILLLKDHADSISGSVVIKKPNKAIHKVLEIAKFYELMTITL